MRGSLTLLHQTTVQRRARSVHERAPHVQWSRNVPNFDQAVSQRVSRYGYDPAVVGITLSVAEAVGCRWSLDLVTAATSGIRASVISSAKPPLQQQTACRTRNRWHCTTHYELTQPKQNVPFNDRYLVKLDRHSDMDGMNE